MKPTFAWLSLLLAFAALAQNPKPDFSGRWTIDTAKSNYGGRPAPKTYVEVIEHKDPALTISSTSEDQRGESKMFLKFTTDDRDCVNEVNGNEFHSKSHWDGAKLVTTVTGDRGLSMVEVRSLSANGKVQTVETYMGSMQGAPAMTRVEDRK
jgi:hypothetical protein